MTKVLRARYKPFPTKVLKSHMMDFIVTTSDKENWNRAKVLIRQLMFIQENLTKGNELIERFKLVEFNLALFYTSNIPLVKKLEDYSRILKSSLNNSDSLKILTF